MWNFLRKLFGKKTPPLPLEEPEVKVLFRYPKDIQIHREVPQPVKEVKPKRNYKEEIRMWIQNCREVEAWHKRVATYGTN